MTSKVLVKLPTVPFPQGKKSPSNLVALTERNDGSNQTLRHQTLTMDRIAQLEQNMKFLQEQHQTTLVALQQEVESLSQKNRDLQFQLVFSKRSAYVASTPSSPEDNGAGFVKSKGSPVSLNVAPLRVELLEKDLQDVKLALQEFKARNQYLNEMVEQQKEQFNSAKEVKMNKQSTKDVGIQVESTLDHVHSDLVAYLEVTERMKRLLKQNADQMKEIAMLKGGFTNPVSSNKGARSRDNNNSHHSRGSPTSTTQEQAPQKFPPLQSQSYWHRRIPRNGRNRHDKQDHQPEMDSTVLPQLQNESVKSDTVIYDSPFYRPRGYRNHYRDESNRKYRGQTAQKDRRDNDYHHHRRDYKDRNSKDQKEFTDSAEGSREANNSAGNKS